MFSKDTVRNQFGSTFTLVLALADTEKIVLFLEKDTIIFPYHNRMWYQIFGLNIRI